MKLILEALDAPQPGWTGRDRYIARQVAIAVIELLVVSFALAMLLLYVFVLTPARPA